ncbi:MAG: sulfite exporter TauE/SafE family protein [Rhodospirillaceae bacterium]|nr:sulfite exporter TauE/SafE family protein [Rhodospirillaceae bacterium]
MTGDYYDYGVVLLVVGVASYIQAVVGFAFGMIVMGGISGLGVLSIAETAIMVALLAIPNTALALRKSHANVRWKEAAVSLSFSLPFLAVGLYLLGLLSATNITTLRMLLALVIIVSATLVLRPPRSGAVASPLSAYAVTGVLSGLMGGMFAIAAPPVVFQFYRQPFPLPVVRDSLLALFMVGATLRTTLVTINGDLGPDLLTVSAIALPVVVLFTDLGRRYPPKVSEQVMRRFVFALLVLSAVIVVV